MPRMISHGGLLIIAAVALLLLGCVKLNPQTATNPVGTEHTVTASQVVTSGFFCFGPGDTVNFTVTGANPMSPVAVIADASSKASFTYTGTNPGTDTITATVKDPDASCAISTDTSTKEWIGPEMSLGAKGAVSCDDPAKPTKCIANFIPADPKARQFQITVNANFIPVASYGGFKSEIFLGGLIYNPRPACADPGKVTGTGEVTWADQAELCSNIIGPGGQILHTAGTGSTVPVSPSSYVGELLQLDVHCQGPGSFKVTLPAFPSSSDGATYLDTDLAPTLPAVSTVGQQDIDLDGDTVTELVDVADTLVIDCRLSSIGGIAELPEVAATPLESPDSSGPSTTVLAGIVAAVAAGTIALSSAAWYARRRWLT